MKRLITAVCGRGSGHSGNEVLTPGGEVQAQALGSLLIPWAKENSIAILYSDLGHAVGTAHIVKEALKGVAKVSTIKMIETHSLNFHHERFYCTDALDLIDEYSSADVVIAVTHHEFYAVLPARFAERHLGLEIIHTLGGDVHCKDEAWSYQGCAGRAEATVLEVESNTICHIKPLEELPF